jgi:hypothetical protein
MLVIDEKHSGKTAPDTFSVVLYSDSHQELLSGEAKNMAIKFALDNKFPAEGIDPVYRVVPVPAEGTVQDIVAGKTHVKEWRITYHVKAKPGYPT